MYEGYLFLSSDKIDFRSAKKVSCLSIAAPRIPHTNPKSTHEEKQRTLFWVISNPFKPSSYLGGQQSRLSRLLLSPTKAKNMVVAQKRKKKVEKTMNMATAMQSTPDQVPQHKVQSKY